MIETIVTLIREQVGNALRRVAGHAAFVLIAALFVFFAVAGLFVALFFWLEPAHGAIAAALICAAVAFGLAVVAALPLLLRPRRPPPPPPADSALPQLLMLMTKSASNLTPRQTILAAAVVGFALLLTARRDARK